MPFHYINFLTLLVVTLLLPLLLIFSSSSGLPVTIPRLPTQCYSQQGLINLGLLIRLHRRGQGQQLCSEQLYTVERLSYLEAFVYAIRDVNSREDLLPNVELGFLALDTCAHSVAAIGRSLYFIPSEQLHGAQSHSSFRGDDSGVASIGSTQSWSDPSTQTTTEYGYTNPDEFPSSTSSPLTSNGPVESQTNIQSRSAPVARRPTNTTENCVDGPPDMPVVGIVGPPSSDDAVLVASLLSAFQIPLISPSATNDRLSDKEQFEYFMRVVPSDRHQVRVMVELLVLHNWTYVSLLYSRGDYGLNAAEKFIKLSSRRGICVAVDRMFSAEVTDEDVDLTYHELLANRKARVVVIFLVSMHQRALFDAARRNEENFRFLWLGSDFMVNKDYGKPLDGALVMYHVFPPVPAFERYFRQLTPVTNAANPWMDAYWEEVHGCQWSDRQSGGDGGKRGDGTGTTETPDLQGDKPPCENFTDFTDWHRYVGPYVAAYMDSVYTYAHALDELLRRECPEVFTSSDQAAVLRACIKQPLLLTLMRNQSFQGVSGSVEFDESGDALAKFSVRQYRSDRQDDKYVEVAQWDTASDRLVMEEDEEGNLLIDWSPFVDVDQWLTGGSGSGDEGLFGGEGEPDKVDGWVADAGRPPESICSRPCGVGHYVLPTKVPCCWECRRCRDNEVVTANGTTCSACPPLLWPDPISRTSCLPIEPSTLDSSHPVALLLAILAAAGVIATSVTGGWYYNQRGHKLVRATSRELSTIILLGIALAYITVLLLVLAPPTLISCALMRVGFHMSVTLIYAPLFVKTLRIYRIFAGAKRGVRSPKMIGNRCQVLMTSVLVTIQVLLVLITCLVVSPHPIQRAPLPQENLVELFCDLSPDGLAAGLVFNLLLMGVCAVLGFLCRDLPENFRESRFILVSVCTTLFLWLVLVPAFIVALYASHKYLLLGWCLLSNAAVTLLCLFMPKAYAVHFVDNANLPTIVTTPSTVVMK